VRRFQPAHGKIEAERMRRRGEATQEIRRAGGG
jgi:hypothetical protein